MVVVKIGMWGSGYTNEWGYGATYGAIWSSQINRVYCNINGGWYLSLQYGTCIYMGDNDYPCFHTQECRIGYTLCMSPNNDGNKRCAPIPTKSQPCNQWQNLIFIDANNAGDCQCIDKYYYYNNTMCVRGSMLGQICTS